MRSKHPQGFVHFSRHPVLPELQDCQDKMISKRRVSAQVSRRGVKEWAKAREPPRTASEAAELIERKSTDGLIPE